MCSTRASFLSLPLFSEIHEIPDNVLSLAHRARSVFTGGSGSGWTDGGRGETGSREREIEEGETFVNGEEEDVLSREGRTINRIGKSKNDRMHERLRKRFGRNRCLIGDACGLGRL